eukprot:5833165-Pleurochrysis_carterae.AAC.3
MEILVQIASSGEAAINYMAESVAVGSAADVSKVGQPGTNTPSPQKLSRTRRRRRRATSLSLASLRFQGSSTAPPFRAGKPRDSLNYGPLAAFSLSVLQFRSHFLFRNPTVFFITSMGLRVQTSGECACAGPARARRAVAGQIGRRAVACVRASQRGLAEA